VAGAMIGEGALEVLIDQICIERDRCGRSFPGRADDLGAGISGVACHPDAGNAGVPHRIVNHPAVRIHRTAQPGEQISIRDEAWANKHRRARDHGAAGQFDAVQVVVVDDEPGDGALDDADATGGQLLALLGAEGVGVGEQGDVGRPLPHQQRVLDSLGGAPKHPEGLVADLIAMGQ
jgi:hypothetical protein